MKASTRLRKLRTLSAVEVRSRIATAAYRLYERRAVGIGQDTSVSTLRRVEPAPEFLLSVRDLSETRRVLESRYHRELQNAIAKADRFLRGEVVLFGGTHRVGQAIDWHADPLSGRRWPLLYHGDMPVGVAGKAPGDAKDVWELNRQQFLLDLSRAWLATERTEYAARAHDVVRSWISDNPYGLGINWSGPLEVAYRALSWIWTYRLTGDQVSDSMEALWLSSFRDHGRFLYRHLELFESPFNHLIGEAAVLYILGVLFPQFDATRRWRQRGRDVLEQRLPEQFYSDGGSVEQAVVYHHATLGFYLLAALVGRNNRDEFSAGVWRAIERAIEFSMYLAQPDGRQPAVGDNDDARPFAFDLQDAWKFGHFQAAGAVLFDRPDFKSTQPCFGEDAFWLLGPDAIPGFEAIVSRPPGRTSCVLSGSGYVVLRTGWGTADDYVLFDCGEQAGGLRPDDIPSAAHGHADALAIVACLDGRPILVDPGFYTYNRERSWERHFRETAAHNTVRIDERDQSVHLETMAWIRAPQVSLETSRLDDAGSWAIGSHNGYRRTPDGVLHRRTVWLRPGHYIVVNDVLVGRGTHQAEVVFQFHEALTHSLTASRVILQDRFFVSWNATTVLEPAVYRGGETPESGWVAPRLAQRAPAARLVLRASFSDTLRVLTVIGDGAIWTSEPDGPDHDRSHGLVQRLRAGEDAEDLVIAPGDAAGGRGTYHTDGSIGVWRFEHGRLVDAAHAGGTFITPTNATRRGTAGG